MTIFVSAANGKTGRSIISALRGRGDAPSIRAFCRTPYPDESGVTWAEGDLMDAVALASAMDGIETVIHYGPPAHPREVNMAQNVIDAARVGGVTRFIYISVIHPEIDDLLNHQMKLAIESELINSRFEWTVLRPQHYMQNIDVRRVADAGILAMPYPPQSVLGHLDMRDLAEIAAKVAVEPGHIYATYDIDGGEHLSVFQMADAIARLSGKQVEARELNPYDFVESLRPKWDGTLSDFTVETLHRLFGYYARNGLYGNSNVLTWLLGRPPRSFDDYVRDGLAGLSGPVSGAY